MNATVTYVGPLADGFVQCPVTCRNYAFKNGKAFTLPENLAVNIVLQSPADWSVSPVVQKLAEDQKKLADAQAAVAKAEAAIAAETEAVNSDQSEPEEKV